MCRGVLGGSLVAAAVAVAPVMDKGEDTLSGGVGGCGLLILLLDGDACMTVV